MPIRDHPPQKKRKTETSSRQSYKYASASEIRRVFKAQSESGLIEGLTALRNQLTIKPNEGPIQVNDERLLLAKAWLEEDPGAQELFNAWEGANTVRHPHAFSGAEADGVSRDKCLFSPLLSVFCLHSSTCSLLITPTTPTPNRSYVPFCLNNGHTISTHTCLVNILSSFWSL